MTPTAEPRPLNPDALGDLYEALVYVRQNLGDPVPIGRRHVARVVDAALRKALGEADQ